MPGKLRRLLSEAGMLVFIALATFLILALLTYTRSDPGWSHASAVGKVSNWGGKVGAFLSDAMLYIFGISAWWWCVMLAQGIWRGYRRLTQKYLLQNEPEPAHPFEKPIRVVSFVPLLVSSTGLEFLRLHSLKAQMPRAPGGVLGDTVGSALQGALGFNGATLLLILMIALSFSLFFHVSWLQVAEQIGAAVEHF